MHTTLDQAHPTVAPTVAIGGWVRQPLTLTAAALALRGDVQAAPFTVVCTLDGAHGGPRPYRGVPLARLIDEAGPDFAQRTDFKRVAIVAESVEGYRALFSWGELFNTAVGAGVLVAWRPDQPNAPCALLSLHDLATGPRFVQGLASVQLLRLW